MNPEVIAIGFVVGALVGLTGVGGGSIMTPLLVIVLKVNPLVAVGTDLLYSVPTKIYGAYLHNKQGTTNWEIVKALCFGGIPATAVGIVGLLWLRQHVDVATIDFWTRRAIGIALVVSAAVIVTRSFVRPAPRTGEAVQVNAATRGRIIALGALVGFIVTITSIGSGSVTLPLLSLALPAVSLTELIGSDIAFAAFLIPSAAAGHWSMGDVNLPLALNLLGGSLPGVYLGSRLCGVLHQRWLRPAVAITLLVVGTRLL